MTAKRIVLPVDGSATAEAAARFAQDIAHAEGEAILVVGVVVRVERGADENSAVAAAIYEFMAAQVAEEATRIRSSGCEAEEIIVVADLVHEGILRVARDRSADMIVMGTHGRTGLTRAVIGSVADKVVKHSPIPVVLVPLRSED